MDQPSAAKDARSPASSSVVWEAAEGGGAGSGSAYTGCATAAVMASVGKARDASESDMGPPEWRVRTDVNIVNIDVDTPCRMALNEYNRCSYVSARHTGDTRVPPRRSRGG